MGRRTAEELRAHRQPPRKPGEGSVYLVRRSDGSEFWRAERILKLDGKSVSVFGSSKASPGEAEARLEKNCEKRKRAAVHVRSGRSATGDYRFSDLVLDWLKWKTNLRNANEVIRSSTAEQYRSLTRLYIVGSPLGAMKIEDITRRDVRTFFAGLQSMERSVPERAPVEFPGGPKQVVKYKTVPHLGPSNLRAIQGIVNMAFKYAVIERELIENNPAFGIEPIRKASTRVRDELLEGKKKIAYKLGELLDGRDDEALWMMSLTTGMRQSEVLGLTIDCFQNLHSTDPKKPPYVIVKHQLVRNRETKEYDLAPPKSEHGIRNIPLGEHTTKLIIEHLRVRNEQIKERKAAGNSPVKGDLSKLVFTMPDGRPISTQRHNKWWHKLLEDDFFDTFQGDYVPLHALRHFVASLLIQTDNNLEAVQKILGHSSTLVSRTYTHLETRDLVDPMARLEKAILRDRDMRTRGEPVPPYQDDEYSEFMRIRNDETE